MRVTRWITEQEQAKYCEAPDTDEVFDAIIANIRENRYCFSGECRQEFFGLIPVIDETYLFSTTWRTWGQLMSEAWNELLGAEKFSYLDFYMKHYLPDGMVLKYPEVDLDEQ